MLGLRLSPDVSIWKTGLFDVLAVPGGYGQQALMHDEEVLELIRSHVYNEKLVLPFVQERCYAVQRACSREDRRQHTGLHGT
jgi:hypothetical protein